MPQPNTTEKSVSIVSQFHPFRQSSEFLGAPTAENDVIGNKRFLQQHDGTKHFALPSLLAEFFEAGLAKVILDDMAVAIRQVAEFKWEDSAVRLADAYRRAGAP